MGCEDLHVYNAPSGPMIFTGCVEKISDQYVFSRNQVRAPLIGDLVSGNYGEEYESEGVLSGSFLCL